MVNTERQFPEGFEEFLGFLCKKYLIDRDRVFVEYNSNPPPPLRGGRPGYYDGLLSYRERNGRPEFLITVFKIARDPLLTLGHEFAHMVEDLKRGDTSKRLGPPDNAREEKFDAQAMRDIAEFRAQPDSQIPIMRR
jgi:hypothetical protein